MDDIDTWYVILYHFQNDFALVILLIGFVISFLLAFAVGANDAANSWGTSVGSKTVSLGWAYFLGSLMEIIGATVLSGDVIKNIAFGIVNIEYYRSDKIEILSNYTSESNDDYLMKERTLMVGCLSVMFGSGLWQMIASWLSWPVAGTHCIIFGLLGFTVAAEGPESIKEPAKLGATIAYMFLSIIVSTIACGLLYYPLYRWCIRSKDPYTPRNKVVFSGISGLAVGIPVTFILAQVEKSYDSPLGILSNYGVTLAYLMLLGVGLAVGLVFAIISLLFFLPAIVKMEGDFALDFTFKMPNLPGRKKKVVEKEMVMANGNGNLTVLEVEEEDEEGDDTAEIKRIFRPLQVMSACTSALVHGANDVANCIGPFVIMWLVFKEGIMDVDKAKADPIVALWGGLGIACGFVFYGKKVIMTLGSNISRMTPSRGFTVEWMSALTVLIFTMFGIPLSTTHCKVGGLIGAGLMRGLVETGSPREMFSYINLKVLSGVLLSWVLTVPAAFGLTAVIFLLLKALVL